MARRSSSSKVATVTQVCDTGCSSRLYRILNFREGQATKRLVSNTRHSNTHAIAAENGNSGKRPDVLNVVDEKHAYNHAKVSSKRRSYYGCKSISCLKNCHVSNIQGNEAINKVVARNFINGKYLCKDGAIISQPHQFFDALQILYTNKELLLKLVQDQNSISVKEQHHLTNDGDDEAKGLESVGRKSDRSAHSGFAKGGKLSSLDFQEREKMKIGDFLSCRGQNAVSVRESRGRNITRTSVSPSRQIIQNMHVEATKNISETLNCRVEEQNNKQPPGAVLKTVKDELHCFHENVEKSPPDNSYAYHGIPTGSEKSIKSGYDLDHPKGIRHMDVPSASEQDSRNMDSPTQSFDVDITSEGNGSAMDSPNVVEDLISSSPEVASSSSSYCQSEDDPMDMRSIVDEHLSSESTAEKVMREDTITNPPTTVTQPDDELVIQAVNDNSEEHHSAGLTRCSLELVNNLITSTDMSESDCDRELLQALSLKWDELVMRCELPDQVMKELIGLKNQISGRKILFDYVMEVFMETYQNLCRFPHHISMGKPNVQAYVLKRIMIHEVKEFMDLHHHQHHQQPPRTLEQLIVKDLARRRSWLNVRADIGDIATEVQEDVLQELILEIISETDIRQV